MKTTIRARRDFQALEGRRMQAAGMFRAGKTQAEVVRSCAVSRQSASRWYRDWRRGGKKALAAAGRAGRLPRLDEGQLQKVARALRAGPRAYGYPTDLWTLSRLAPVVKKLTGIAYHPGHIWRLMGKMGWSLQRPAKRAKERDERAIRQWKEKRWPVLKKTPAAGKPGSSSKTRVE